MASNFEIGLNRSEDLIVMNLEGDFDATSAYELIYAIYTNGLKSIYPAGIDVFRRLMHDLNHRPRKIALKGHHATRLWPENLRVASMPHRITSWW
jgi:hypothetical protein